MRMKMPEGGPLRILSEERGVAGLMVAITMVVLLGMVALSMDFGLMLVKRRATANANDAAALAAAGSCARGDGQADADGRADTFASDNVSNAVRADDPAYDPSCDASSGTVTVHYQSDQTLYFAPIVGIDSPKTISFTSTAKWGVAGGAGGVLPVMVNSNRLGTCDIPGTEEGTECWFWMDNGPGGLGNASWALLNVQPVCGDGKYGWDVSVARCGSKVRNPDPTYSCPAFSSSEMIDLINNGSGDLSMSPGHTYVCTAPGAKTPVFRGIGDLAGTTRLFPVNYPPGQIKKGGIPAPPPVTPDFYDIIGFVQMKIVDVWRGTDSGWDTANCPGPKGNNAWCLHAVWVGFTTESGSICDTCEDFGIRAVKLSG
jgi:Flp pilus assembly protein TadG